MVMSWIWTGLIAVSILSGVLNGCPGALSAAVLEGAQAGVALAISMTGSICLWSGIGALMQHLELTQKIGALLAPLLNRLFPESREGRELSGIISANICANLLGLGNAATPMGIEAAKRLRSPQNPTLATDSLCRLVVLNTASIQLIPSNVAAIRLSLGCNSPFDILPAVWVSSFSSAAMGIAAAWLLGKVWRHD